MKDLEQRLLDDAQVGEGDIIHVDMFLNHCIDVELIERIGNELARRFKGDRITKVLTVESSGIAIACFVGRALKVPVIYAKKFQTGYIDPNVYSAETHSFSLDKSYTIRGLQKYLDEDDTVLIVDDILSNGQSTLALLELVSKAGGEVAGGGRGHREGHAGAGQHVAAWYSGGGPETVERVEGPGASSSPRLPCWSAADRTINGRLSRPSSGPPVCRLYFALLREGPPQNGFILRRVLRQNIGRPDLTARPDTETSRSGHGCNRHRG